MKKSINPVYDTILSLAQKKVGKQQNLFIPEAKTKSLPGLMEQIEILKKQSQTEAQIHEDEDYVHYPALTEQCPICDQIQEIIEWIENSILTRVIEGIGVHCSGSHIRTTVSGMLAHWKKLGWINPGYHIVVHYDGSITVLLDLNQISNGVKGFNSKLINICTIGGVDDNGKITNTLSPEQFNTMSKLITAIKKKKSNLYVQGHRDFPKVNKACPCYDAKTKYINA